MARHLFIGQKTLDAWLEQDKIIFDDNVMTVKADGRRFKLVEAVRFVQVEGGDEDTVGLIGKVKTNRQLKEMGAERYRDSVIYQDVAYRVQEGFIGEVFARPQAVQARRLASPTEAPASSASGPLQDGRKETQAPHGVEDQRTEEELTDEELLARFLLGNTLK